MSALGRCFSAAFAADMASSVQFSCGPESSPQINYYMASCCHERKLPIAPLRTSGGPGVAPQFVGFGWKARRDVPAGRVRCNIVISRGYTRAGSARLEALELGTHARYVIGSEVDVVLPPALCWAYPAREEARLD